MLLLMIFCPSNHCFRSYLKNELRCAGGKQGGPKVPAYMDVKLKEVLVTAV
jgi:hypothetical protein